MKKLKVFCGSLVFLLLTILISPVLVKADGMPLFNREVSIWDKETFLIAIWNLFVTYFSYPLFNWLVEGTLAKSLLKKKIPIVRGFMKSFFIINFITYYPAFFLIRGLNNIFSKMGPRIGYFLGITVGELIIIIVVEMLVVIAEYFMIVWRMRKMYPDLVFGKQTVSKREIFAISLLVNLFSFILGGFLEILFGIFSELGVGYLHIFISYYF